MFRTPSSSVATILKIALILVSLATAAAFVAGFFTGGNAKPFAWTGDTHGYLSIRCPSAQVVNDGFVATTDDIDSWHQQLRDLSWPITTGKTVDLPCEGEAQQGEVRYHSCDEPGPDGQMMCGGTPGEDGLPDDGETLSRFLGGKVIASDIYLQPADDRAGCAGLHETVHWAGATSDDPDERDGAWGVHTSLEGHLMSESCGNDMRWMDRGPSGDWPHGAPSPSAGDPRK